jgi:hypothetical protein
MSCVTREITFITINKAFDFLFTNYILQSFLLLNIWAQSICSIRIGLKYRSHLLKHLSIIPLQLKTPSCQFKIFRAVEKTVFCGERICLSKSFNSDSFSLLHTISRCMAFIPYSIHGFKFDFTYHVSICSWDLELVGFFLNIIIYSFCWYIFLQSRTPIKMSLKKYFQVYLLKILNKQKVIPKLDRHNL